MIEFETYDITKDTQAEEVNEFLRGKNVAFINIMDLGSAHKRLWIATRTMTRPIPEEQGVSPN